MFEPYKELKQQLDSFDISDQYKAALDKSIFLALNTAIIGTHKGLLSIDDYYKHIRTMKDEIESSRFVMSGNDVWTFDYLAFERHIVGVAKQRMWSHMNYSDVKLVKPDKYGNVAVPPIEKHKTVKLANITIHPFTDEYRELLKSKLNNDNDQALHPLTENTRTWQSNHNPRKWQVDKTHKQWQD